VALRRFELAAPTPFRLDLTAWALRRRAHNAVDRFDGTWYRRSLVLQERILDVGVRQYDGSSGAGVVVELGSFGTTPSSEEEAQVGTLLRRVLGLDLDLAGFYRLAERDERLSRLALRFVGMRPPRFASTFEALVNAVACQQLSLTVGIHLLNRLAAWYGPAPEADPALAGFPTPERLAVADPVELRALGFSGSIARTIVSLSVQVASGELDLAGLDGSDDDKVRAVLLGITGVGRWSTEYALLRGLGRLHVLPGDDVGARNNLRRRFGLDPAAGYPELSALGRSWWPYGGLVYFHLLLDALAESGQVEPTTPGRSPMDGLSAGIGQVAGSTGERGP